MKSEDDSEAVRIPACPAGAGSATAGAVGRVSAPQKRTVCDHCRRRRIRCDGQFPCQQCHNAALACKRDHVPRKRGPKRGHGRVINELRAQGVHEKEGNSRESSPEFDLGTDSGPQSAPGSVPSTPPPDISWNKVTSDPRNAPEPRSIFTSEQYHPNSLSYLHLIPQCVELYYEHIYPIMPLPYMPAVREMIARPMTASEKNYIYSLCALTSFHMSGQSIDTSGPPSWEVPGRFFLDACISVRQSYDFLEDSSLNAVVSSFWLSTSFFEINQSRKSWLYLREALTLALDLGLQDDSTYPGLSPEEKLCRQRVFWQLFVTERSFAILRNKPITFKKTPSLPTTRHPYESPDIHSGFLQLISSYAPLDESFVTAWNDGSDPRVSATTYLALQNLLAVPPAFLSRSRAPSPISDHTDDDHEPTAIQKADLLITQQWLRLIVWQSSFRQGLLSWHAPAESMHFAFPLAIARRTASVLAGLPPQAVEVHGMGIFEKIFEIGTWTINVLGASDNASLGGAAAGLGMDFVGSSDLGVLGTGRKGWSVDPLEFFVKTLSGSPNSRTQFAERLLMFAAERPGGMKLALSPGLSEPSTPGGLWSKSTSGASSVVGSVLGEVVDEVDAEGPASAGMADVVPGFNEMDLGILSDDGSAGLSQTGGSRSDWQDYFRGAGQSGGVAVSMAQQPAVQTIEPTLATSLSDWSPDIDGPNGSLNIGVNINGGNTMMQGISNDLGFSMDGGIYQDESTPRNLGTGIGGTRPEDGDFQEHVTRQGNRAYQAEEMGDRGVW